LKARSLARCSFATAELKERSAGPVTEESSRNYAEGAIETDNKISESAVEDDYSSSEWEDIIAESSQSRPEDRKRNLSSRPSLLTMIMQQPLALRQSQLPMPDDKTTEGILPDDDKDKCTLVINGPSVLRLKPIITKLRHSAIHSPRKIRKNMLENELSQSLHRHMMLERRQRTSSAYYLTEQHTACEDMAHLKFPEGGRGVWNGSETSTTRASINFCFEHESCDYHSRGW
jgi:hypothetical protein